jgi:hypothetical protein
VLVLRVAVGMSAEETAQAVGSTTGAVRVTQHRALARLRRFIQQGDAAAEVGVDSAPDDRLRHGVILDELGRHSRDLDAAARQRVVEICQQMIH